MCARYPFGTHRGSFPSKIEVVTAATRDVYGALSGALTNASGASAQPSGVCVPARVQRSRIEEVNTQPAVTTNRVRTSVDGIRASTRTQSMPLLRASLT